MSFQNDDHTLFSIAFIAGVPIPSNDVVSQQFINNVAAIMSVNPSWRVKVFAEKPTVGFENVNVQEHYGIAQDIPIEYITVPTLPKKWRKHYSACKAILAAGREKFDFYFTRHPETLLWSLLAGHKTFFDTYRINLNQRAKYLLWRKYCYTRPHFCGVIAHSKLCAESFLNVCLASSKITIAYNGSHPGRQMDGNETMVLRRQLNIDDGKLVICYAGRISDSSKGSGMLLDLAQQLPNIIFLFVGGGKKERDESDFDNKIRTLRLSNVRRTGWVEPSAVSRYLQLADILLIPPTAAGLEKKGNTVLPIKTFQYLQAGRAIVAPDLPDCREILQNNQNAILVRPDDLDAARKAVQVLSENSDLRISLSRNAYRDGLKYTWTERAKFISAFIRTRSAS
ncbi:MAG TPA: glycosyltransferase family 4 protein [bacterium]|nr:glycosyltransferase family 4 protein [bacterium]HMY37317.1 glycosyltransferase family 4 protein [bacterium]HMZ04359.1 glycosyltransferase family 4 protein [bacterium]HNB09137.1 glycosyltransferase family 4 protein [bacterium]HNB57446.1 glycosyltransferase family 4 protein [bacterium]